MTKKSTMKRKRDESRVSGKKEEGLKQIVQSQKKRKKTSDSFEDILLDMCQNTEESKDDKMNASLLLSDESALRTWNENIRTVRETPFRFSLFVDAKDAMVNKC